MLKQLEEKGIRYSSQIIKDNSCGGSAKTNLHTLTQRRKEKKQNKHSCIRKQMIKMMFLKLRNF